MAIRYITNNAKRLLRDARLLYSQKRYRTATALAILSVEESGKACLAKWVEKNFITPEEFQKGILEHVSKQRIIGCFIGIVSVFEALIEFTSKEENFPLFSRGPEEFDTQKDYTRYTFREFFSFENAKLMTFLKPRVEEKIHETSGFIDLGLVDIMKEQGFYDDIVLDNKNKVRLSRPFYAPKSKDARKWIEFAATASRMPMLPDDTHKKMSQVYKAMPRYVGKKKYIKELAERLSKSNKMIQP